MIKESGWRIAVILILAYLLETLMMPLVESPSDDGVLEHVYNLILAIFSVWLVAVAALALTHLISIWRFSEQSYRQRILVGWPICFSCLMLVLVLFTAMAFTLE
ncbi:MAG: hypothetical protein J7619_29450 [Dyadobacter sp.]|uniref:hypothetical protein n=1 Tax=Dyadobacter sp. TaxID=1914288 RepID=UPI001B28C38B|nr:hypothetical protein [Dyadobacter sp.]MBO9616848.1 hypothetical protein [Dyadobacter sp.]